MSARPTRTGPLPVGPPAGGLVSQRSADAGVAAAANAALARNRLRCTSALHRAVEMATVSVHAVGRCRPRSAGRSLAVMPSPAAVTGLPTASVRTLAISSGTGGRGCSPDSQRSTEVWSQRMFATPRALARSATLRARPLLDIPVSSISARSRRFAARGRCGTAMPLPPAVDTISLTFPQAPGPVEPDSHTLFTHLPPPPTSRDRPLLLFADGH